MLLHRGPGESMSSNQSVTEYEGVASMLLCQLSYNESRAAHAIREGYRQHSAVQCGAVL